MSIRIITAVFAAEFKDLKDGEGKVIKGRTAKYVLLALADHADEKGRGAYPSLTRMERKTGLSHQTILSAYKALRHNGIITYVGRSRRGTSNYTINTKCLPGSTEDQPHLDTNQADVPLKPVEYQDSSHLSDGLKPVEYQDSNHLSGVLKPLELNRPLTALKPSNDDDESKTAAALRNLTHLYETTIGAITPLMADLLRNASLDFPAEWFEPAFQAAVKNNSRRWNYIETILDGWKRNGFGWKPEHAKPFHRSTRPKDLTTLLLESIQNGE